MKKTKLNFKLLFTALSLAIVLYGCKPLIALYDQYAYTQATSIKVDLQNLIEESSTVSYHEAGTDIQKVTIEIQKAYEYSKGISANSITTAQYAILLSNTDFYKSFLATWKTQDKESTTAANEMSIKAGQLMDKIIQLENGKNKPKNN